jgi:Mrp family chromosome partitioning ATPase
MRQIRAGGAHLVGTGPPLNDFGGSLSATQADGVVLMLAPGAVSGRALGTAIEQTHRLGIPVHGVILNSQQELAEGQIR